MQEARSGGAGRFVGAGVAIFLVAILMARFLLASGDLWIVFALAVPLLLVILSLAFGFVRALLLVAFFTCAVLAFRWLFAVVRVPWPALLMLPAVLFASLLAWRVARALWLHRDAGPEGAARQGAGGESEPEKTKEEGEKAQS